MSVLTSEARPGSPMETKDCERSDMDESVTHRKASDSGYSNSCSNNSQSQRSGSSKSRTSGSSSGSSGYNGHPPTAGNSHESSFQRPSATKRKDHKKKKLKVLSGDLISSDIGGAATSCSTNSMEPTALKSPTNNNMGLESAILTPSTIQNSEIESHQMNSLSHNAMGHDHIKKMKAAEANAVENFEEAGSSSNSKEPKTQSLRLLEDLKIAHPKEQFMLVVSMQEGSVLYTTPNMTNVLGYPKDMWMGRSLFDFVHPKDRNALNKYITSCIAGPLVSRHSQNQQTSSAPGVGLAKQSINTFHCCLRQYRGLKSSGFSVIEKKVDYLPCKISFFFHELNQNKLSPCATPGANNDKSRSQNQSVAANDGFCDTLLIANASLIHSAYLDADEACRSPTFVTQHSTSMCLTHVDNEVIPYFGYMPHDMVGRSVFDFYHPDDLPYLKEVYKNVLKDKSQLYRGGKPYRFRTQNGSYALVETDWCGYVNPWTKKLEFIIGQHHIVKGPPQPDVTTVVEQYSSSLSEEIVKESNEIREEIVKLLNDTGESTDEAKMKISKCGKEIITYMEKFFDEEKTAQTKSLPLSFFLSFSQDRDSVMLGEISPHHEYCDSKSSSETPPSYNQLNYNDNIERFFESKPKTTRSDESNGQNSTERNTTPLSNGEEDGGKLSPTDEMNCNRNSCSNNGSGVGSSDLSFGSTGIVENSSNENDNVGKSYSYRTPHLTEELLCRHNENMEKKMVQKHRERSKTDRELKLKDSRMKKNYEKLIEAQGSHGVKRSGSHSWEGEPYKSIKQTHAEPNNAIYYSGENNPIMPTATSAFPAAPVSVTTNVNLWPPFSVTVTPMHNNTTCQSHLNHTTNLSNPMTPLYYIPPEMPSNVPNVVHHSKGSAPSYIPTPAPYVSSPVQYLGSMMYHPIAMPMFGAAPLMISPLTMLPAPLVPSQPMKPLPKRNIPPSEHQTILPPIKTIQRPTSRATSAKAEPGSALCSITSNSLYQALSDFSKRGIKSMCDSSPSLMSQDSSASMEKKAGFHNNSDLHGNTHNDSSSYYSSFYSYMKTDEKSDESMKSLTENESSSDANGDGKHESVWEKSFGNIGCKNSEELMERHIRKNPVNERKRSYKMMSQNDEHHKQFEPPWTKDVAMTPDIIFKYQVSDRVLAEVLESDLKILAEINQPLMVNEQLCQLYLDLDSFSQNDCTLETSLGFTSSSGSSAEGEDGSGAKNLRKKKKRATNYDRMGMMFEENAPMPPPLQNSQLSPMASSCTTAA